MASPVQHSTLILTEVRALRTTHPTLGVKGLVRELRDKIPDVDCRAVRNALATLEVEDKKAESVPTKPKVKTECLSEETCLICCEAPRQVRFLPCKHKYLCTPCTVRYLSKSGVPSSGNANVKCIVCKELVERVQEEEPAEVQPPSVQRTDSFSEPSGDGVEVRKWMVEQLGGVDQMQVQKDFHNACRYGNLKEAKKLRTQGADVNLLFRLGRDDTVDCVTPLMAVIMSASNDNLEFAQWLHDEGADLNLTSSRGSIPHLSVIAFSRCSPARSDALAKWLLELGAELQQVDVMGWTPLHYAARENKLEFARFLVEQGHDLFVADISGQTPLRVTINNNSRSCLSFFHEQMWPNSYMSGLIRETAAFIIGDRVRVRGLKGRSELNGQEGTVFDPQRGANRVPVRLYDDGAIIAIMPKNLEKL